ncbi:endonuclease/exonuclease/phosphatase family protein [Lysobacter korlensis]|uniref:Endonuclease/exonuclease/phosphatase family protein n=1 Tax=Lysobacter korlensis TaxID=553636 RepID=A0ABV6RND8_9GAMM
MRADDELRVMTWNVWWRFGGNWREREPGILSVLRDEAPDIVGLQEAWATDETSQPDEFGRALGMHAAFAPMSLPPEPDPVETEDQRGVRMGIGLLSRWPVLHVDAVPMPSPDTTVVALSVTVAHPLGPLHVIVAGTDWEPERLPIRAAQLAELGELALMPALDGPLPVLVVGDLNAGPEADDFRKLTEILTDCWAVAADRDDDERTLSDENRFAPAEATLQYNRRIDHVLARPGHPGARIEVRQARILRDEFDGMPPSDHYPVVVDLALTVAAGAQDPDVASA